LCFIASGFHLLLSFPDIATSLLTVLSEREMKSSEQNLWSILVIGFYFHVASGVVIFVLLKYILIYIIFNYLCIIFCEECITEVRIVDTPYLLDITKVLHHCHVCSCLCTSCILNIIYEDGDAVSLYQIKYPYLQLSFG